MANFTVRVELHDAENGDYYDRLHEEMEARGFVRWIKDSNDDAKLRLPTAEYNLRNTGKTKGEVLTLAQEAADAVKPKPKPSIVVTKSAGRTWSGLKKW